MTEPRGLLDTSVVIDLGAAAPDELPGRPVISAVTLAELSVGPLVARDESQRSARQLLLQFAEANFEALPFDSAAARAFGPIASSLRRRGRKVAARSFDAMIAAVAIANGLRLHTRNPNDFRAIEGLEVVAVGAAG